VPLAVGAVLLTGVVLRFVAPPDLWLDEAQSVAIARLGLPDLFQGLREDGAPPLYYLLLDAWMALFGDSAFAVRALSGVLSVLALPLAWVLGRRLAGRRGGLALVLLLASSPFAIRYGSETRMYSLVVLLVLAGGCAVHWAARTRGAAPVVAVGLVAAALLLTHYWSFFLLTAVGLACLVGVRQHRPGALRVLAGLVLGGLGFLPWLPSLRVQLAHTGTPWAEAGGLSSVTTALGSWQGGGGAPAVLLGDALFCLVVLALVAVPAGTGGSRVVRLGLSRSWTRWCLLATSAGTLVVAGVASLLTDSAVGGRYSSVAFPSFLALVAAGLAVLPGKRAYAAVLVVLVLLGLGVAVGHVRTPRTQGGEVAEALERAAPGDTVAFCPDQLGPAVSRLAPPGLDLVVYPDLRPTGRVDWTDYAERNGSADPARVAAALAGRAGGHAIWVVTGNGYRVPSDSDCRDLRVALAALRGEPELVVGLKANVVEGMRLDRFPAP
jgi:4-amino-4-deoxy-L-arabinose transferase-like glycosyltransferase